MIWVENFKSDDSYIEIKNVLNSSGEEVEMGVVLPPPHVMSLVNCQFKRKIVSIEGFFDDTRDSKTNKAIYPPDYYDIIPGDQYFGIRVLLTYTNELDGSKENEEYIVQISDWQNCCEVWGCFLSEDDLSRYIGAELLEIYFTDTSLNTEYVQKIASYKARYDCHNVQFVNFKTNRGIFQFTVYNCHNGYYGHDVSLIHNGNEIYKTQI